MQPMQGLGTRKTVSSTAEGVQCRVLFLFGNRWLAGPIWNGRNFGVAYTQYKYVCTALATSTLFQVQEFHWIFWTNSMLTYLQELMSSSEQGLKTFENLRPQILVGYSICHLDLACGWP